MNLNIDSKTLEACLKTINNVGSTTYQNICTGEATVVPWGVLDWISNSIFLIIGLIFLLLGLAFSVYGGQNE